MDTGNNDIMSEDKSLTVTFENNTDGSYDYDIDLQGGYRKKESRYVNLKVNGKLFPSWIMKNFNRYKLPEIFLDGSDPCNEARTKSEIRKYQEFLGRYLDYNSPYRDIMIYHGLGSGKTRSAINIYNILYNSSPDWNVFVLLKATLKESTWVKELERWLQKDEKEFRSANIHFISYDAPNADKMFLETVKNVDAAKKSMYIIEEFHNFINNVYTNISSKQGRRALTIYEHIIQDKQDNDGVRVIMISGSPAINIPFELALTFNLLRPGCFPKHETEFNRMYVSSDGYPTINAAKKNNFQRRILGLVSYYIGSTPEYFAQKRVNYVDVPMSGYQTDIYSHYEKIEQDIARKMRSASGGNYKSYTRQSCNFVFPAMKQGMNGETRPRPRDFKVKESEILAVSKGKVKEDKKAKYYKVNDYLVRVDEFADELDKHFGHKHQNDESKGHTLMDDVAALKKIDPEYTIRTFDDYMRNAKKTKSSLLEEMHKSSAKMTFMIMMIMRSHGPTQVYSNYVVMEGLQIFKIYLKYFGFTSFFSKERGKDGFRYTEYHGGIDPKDRRKVLESFNRSENKLGDVCKIIMISPAGAEGISLNNIRQVHLMEPYWHEVRITQMIGRAIRQCSHRDLPMKDRFVEVYRYKSVRPGGGNQRWTTDQYIESMARSKEGLIQSFLDTMKEAAVDCELNKNHNSMVSNYRCFQFEEKSLFDDQIGPAYIADIYDDQKLDNGLNSANAAIRRIKALKIKAVRQIVEDPTNIAAGEAAYSEPEDYWFSPETLTVYDFEMKYPIGKVGADDDDLPIKLDKDTYIITKVIPIPVVKGK
jgi:Helicase conserved C-terminal domain/Type III restriction enzyme, res subunit